jgi:hypothetical protein
MKLPNNQKAAHTRGFAPEKNAFKRALYIAQEEDGEPGRGSMSDYLQVKLIILSSFKRVTKRFGFPIALPPI